jgi:hypothetical protein
MTPYRPDPICLFFMPPLSQRDLLLFVARLSCRHTCLDAPHLGGGPGRVSV